jgi:signal transduction histidine kinase
MGVLLSTAFGAVVWRQRVLTGELLEARQQLTEQAILDERRWIAREVHDLVGHSLSVALLHVTGARHLLRRDLDEAEQALLEAERAGRENLAEIRRTVALLRDGGGFGTRPTPGVSDVADLVAEYRRGGLNVELAVQGPTARVDPVTGLAVYRVVQESLANVAKHAPGGRATVDIRVATDGTTLDVCNSVSGRPPVARAGGVGIVGMRERARAAGGDLQAGLTHGGWKVTAWLPNARDDGADPRPSEEAP